MGPLTTAAPITFVLTRDRAALEPFYRDVLGLKLVSSDPFGTVFALGDGSTILRLTSVENHAPGMHTVLGWSVPDIRSTMRDMAEKGVVFQIFPGFGQDVQGIWTAPDGAAMVSWFYDPEGNGLSLTQN